VSIDRDGSHQELRLLRDALACLAFPARQDDVLAELVTHHAPAGLVQRVRTLPAAVHYRSLADLCAHLDETPTRRTPPPWA